jgi:hypothetical protein
MKNGRGGRAAVSSLKAIKQAAVFPTAACRI